MSDYTPTTDEVRNNMALGIAVAKYVVPEETHAGNVDWPIPGMREKTKQQFDRWLAEHDASVWDQGFLRGLIQASRINEDETLADWEYPTGNPYRADQNVAPQQCPHPYARVKFDGGKRAVVCNTCDTIVTHLRADQNGEQS